MKKFHNMISIVIAVIIIFFDQISKKLISSYLLLGDSIGIIENIFHITLVHNRGAGFGILQGARVFFIIFSFIVITVLIWKWKKIPSRKNISLPLGFIIGGLFGNLIDRIFLGYVVDFLDFKIWPVFNLADSFITIGVIWLVISLWRE